MAVKIQHLRSSTASKRPTTAALLDGELSINTNLGTTGVFFRGSDGTSVIKVGPAEVGSSAPNATPASGGSAGNSVGEFWLDTANAGGNGQRALKIYDGSTWQYAGSVTLGSTNVQLGATTSSLSGLTGVTSGTFTATTGAILNNQSYLRFYEATANGTNYVGFRAPAAISTDLIWTLPSADGSNGQVLQTNGSGVLTWASFSGNSISQADSSVAVSDTGTNGTITFTTDGSSRWVINSSGNLVPSTDSTYNIGASGTEVSNIWVDTLTCQVAANFNGNVTLGDATTDTIAFTGRASSSLLPATSNTYALGGASNLWSEVRATNLYGTIQTASQTNITGVGTITTGTWSSALDGETFSVAAAVTAGTNAQGQGALTKDYNVVTTASANPSGVTLPTAATGRRVAVVNKGANPVNVYPATGAAIDALAANASVQIPVGGVLEFLASSTTQWYSTSNDVVNAGYLTGTIPSGVLGNSTLFIGTTSIALNRTSGSQSLTGITSIDGSAATLTTTRTLWGQNFNGSANVTGSLTSVGDITATAAINITSATTNAITIDSGTTGNVNVGTGANAKAIAIGNSSVSSTIALNNNTTLPSGKTLTLSGATSGTIALQATGIAGTQTITFPALTGTVALTANKLSDFAATTSAELAGVISDETGTGSLVFNTNPAFDGETFSVTAAVTAGTNTQGQGALTKDFNVITTASSNPSGVTLPTATTGRRVYIVNRGANPVNVYPATGGTIDALTINTSIQIPVNGVMFFNASSTTQWYSSSFLTAANGAVTSFSAGTTGLTPSTATTGAVTLAGTLAVANGGTGQTSYTDGQLLIGNSTGNTLTKATLTASTGISITNGSGSISLAVTGAVPTSIATGSGTVTPSANSFTLAGGTGISTSGVGSTATIALTDTGVSAGSYGSPSSVATFTVNAKGQLTAAATASISITASQVSNFDTQVRTSRLDQMAAPTGPVSFNSQRITDLATPLLPTDAATKAYADSIAQSLNVHGAVDYATTGAVSYTYTSGGTSLTITTITGTDTITFSADHGLSLNSQIRTGDTTTGTGLTANTTYYVTAIPAVNQVKVSSTYGGANATLTNGTGLSIGVTGDPGIGATLSGCPNTIDSGSTLTIGQRILVKDHTTAAYNGVYAVTTVGTGANGVWTRTTDFDNGPTGEITAGDYIFVASGTINGSNGFVQTSPPPVRMGKSGAGYTTFTGDSISFTQFSGAGQITAGNGLTKSGNTLDVNPDSRASGTKTIAIVSDEVRIDTAWTGQTSLTTLGTITTGTWNATAIGLAYGGTGQSNTNITSRHVFMGPAGTNGNAAFREFTTADVNPTTNGSFDAGVY